MSDAIDMTRFVEAKSDQLNADDLIGADRILTVTRVTGSDGDQPIAIHYQGDSGKPFKPCKTIRRVLLAIWGRNAADYVGRSMSVYRDDEVTFGGLKVGGIRIRAMSHIDKETVVVVMKTKGKKAGIKIMPLRQSEQTGSKPKMSAAEWVSEYETGLQACADLKALQSYQTDEQRAKWVDALKSRNSDLHQRVLDANAKRFRELSEPEGGRTDEQFGDQFEPE